MSLKNASLSAENLLTKGLQELGIAFTKGQINAFMTYLSELKKWNRAYNLTALKTDEDIIIKHFLDSLLYLKAIPPGPLKLADAGAGAGFPGIPLKIVRPEIEIALIEASRKKAAFLRHMTRLLRLAEADVIEQRLEHLGNAYEKGFDVIVSRATFSTADFLKMACPYVKDNGMLILNKGPKVSEELKELEQAYYERGPAVEVMTVHLPFADVQRNLVVLSCKMKP
ncbi:MAG: 16S rRNA (guanine(527)-N(7))-methyltransferase RsmG [Nitrospirae bacterium]|nr:16S rRNA (guanine(527)-N(7))-methyltransferase RsmG [Nitrospirota bacterium]